MEFHWGAFRVSEGAPLIDERQSTETVDEPQSGETPATTPAPAAETAAEPFDPERAKALIAKLREEARDARKLKSRVDELERERLSEAERLQRDYETAVAERDEARKQLAAYRTEAIARDAGAIYPDLVAAKLPVDVLDDERGLRRELDKLRAAYPNLFTKQNGSVDGGVTGAPVAGMSLNDAIRELARTPR